MQCPIWEINTCIHNKMKTNLVKTHDNFNGCYNVTIKWTRQFIWLTLCGGQGYWRSTQSCLFLLSSWKQPLLMLWWRTQSRSKACMCHLSFVLFAVDNTDFAEHTADGKGTTHGTVTAIYLPEGRCTWWTKGTTMHWWHRVKEEFSINNSGVADNSHNLDGLSPQLFPGWRVKPNSGLGWLQLIAVNKQATDRGWCFATTPRRNWRGWNRHVRWRSWQLEKNTLPWPLTWPSASGC